MHTLVLESRDAVVDVNCRGVLSCTQATQRRITEVGWKCPYDLSVPSALPGAPSLPVLTSEMFLVELLANASYSDASIRQLSPFLLVDVQFNAVLAASDMALAKMAQTLQLHSTVGTAEKHHLNLMTDSMYAKTMADSLMGPATQFRSGSRVPV